MAKTTAKKPGTPPDKGEQNGTHEFIEHEHVAVQKQPQVTEITVVTVEEQIKMEVAKFGNAETEIATLKQQYADMSITTKEDYELVKKAWNQVREVRTGIEKQKAAIKKDYIVIGKAIDAAEARLITLIKPLEDVLYGRWKQVDLDKEADKARKLKEEEDKLKARIQELVDAGMALLDGWYCLGDSMTVDVATVRGMPDDKYAAFLGKVTTTAARLKEQAQQETLRKQREKELEDANKQKLMEQKAALDKQQKELQDREKELERQRQAAAKVRRDNQLNAMKAMGYSYSTYDDEFRLLTRGEPIVIPGAKVFEVDEETFAVSSATWKKEAIDADKALKALALERQEADRQLALKKDRIASLFQGLGMKYSYDAGTFTFENRVGKVTATMDDALELSEATLAKRVEETGALIKQKIADQTTLENTEKQQAELARQEKLGDKALLGEYFDNLRRVATPYSKIRSKGALGVYNTFNAGLVKLLSTAELSLKQLSEEGQP